MAGQTCYQHPEISASSICKHCERPTCSSCTLVAPTGKFCSPECNLLHREGISRPDAEEGSTGQMAKVAVLVLLFLIFGVMAIHLLKTRIPVLQKWDLIEKVKGSAAE
ncbi:MAG: hypothetical protein QF645_02215 [Planctomycetota bacterium]|nr:hypothetical protein [Planctomycetota bacterium]